MCPTDKGARLIPLPRRTKPSTRCLSTSPREEFALQQKKKSGKPKTKDKLSEDKRYLRLLRKNITNNMYSNAMDHVTKRLSTEVETALNFFDMRKEFWRQMEINSIRKMHYSK